MDQERIGKFIAKCRKEKNLTQEQLAELLGVTNKSISRWENGKTMPDYSLIKPLCQKLNITINELLSGEKIQNASESKFEENIINTLNYSAKKIKHTKFIFKIALVIIIVFSVILFTLFNIDLYRMKNNLPVLFSTWGMLYNPPVNLDDINIEETIKEYLIKEDEKIPHHDNEVSFVALNTYLIKETKNTFFVYTWVLQEKYYEENGEIKEDSGASIPYKFIVKKENASYIVESYTIPGDGSDYVKDMKKIFPRKVLKEMDKVYTDGTIERLSKEIENDIKLYYHL